MSRYVALMLMVLFVVSCSSEDRLDVDIPEDEIPGTDIPVEEEVRFEVLSDTTYDYQDFVSGLIDRFADASGLNPLLQTLLKGSFDKYLQSIRSSCGLEDQTLGFRKVAYAYDSIDQHGEPAELSAMALWLGYFEKDEWHDLSPDAVALVEHFTVTSNEECPSEGFPFEAFVNGNSLVIMPDYIGYGVSADMIHPYMNHQVCALNSVDALAAGFAAFDDLSMSDMPEDWEMTVMGASQGGGNALAVHRMMDEDPGLAEKWHFASSYCAAGAYDPALTVDMYLEYGKTDFPVLFPLTIKSMYDSYPEILGDFEEEDFYCANYLSMKSDIDDAIGKKELSVAKLNRMCIDYFRTDMHSSGLAYDEISVNDILSEEIMDRNSEIFKAFYRCLEMNDLTTGWTPSHPVKLYYSETDSVVPFENSMAVRDAFGDGHVTLVKGLSFEHEISCALWMLDVMTQAI